MARSKTGRCHLPPPSPPIVDFDVAERRLKQCGAIHSDCRLVAVSRNPDGPVLRSQSRAETIEDYGGARRTFFVTDNDLDYACQNRTQGLVEFRFDRSGAASYSARVATPGSGWRTERNPAYRLWIELWNALARGAVLSINDVMRFGSRLGARPYDQMAVFCTLSRYPHVEPEWTIGDDHPMLVLAGPIETPHRDPSRLFLPLGYTNAVHRFWAEVDGGLSLTADGCRRFNIDVDDAIQQARGVRLDWVSRGQSGLAATIGASATHFWSNEFERTLPPPVPSFPRQEVTQRLAGVDLTIRRLPEAFGATPHACGATCQNGCQMAAQTTTAPGPVVGLSSLSAAIERFAQATSQMGMRGADAAAALERLAAVLPENAQNKAVIQRAVDLQRTSEPVVTGKRRTIDLDDDGT